MSWIRSSRGVVLGIVLAVALVAVGTAAAITISDGAPAPAEVNETVTLSVTVEDPFEDMPDQWTLRGETGLEDASWTVQQFQQGSPQGTDQYGGQSFEQPLDIGDGTDELEIEVSGTVPSLGTLSYEDRERENYTAVALSSVVDSSENELSTITGHRFTEESREARRAIDDAIDAAGGTNDNIERAISSYDNGNFENAREIANDAESGAQSSQLILIAVGVVIVIALVGGGVYYWREQRQSDYKLQ